MNFVNKVGKQVFEKKEQKERTTDEKAQFSWFGILCSIMTNLTKFVSFSIIPESHKTSNNVFSPNVWLFSLKWRARSLDSKYFVTMNIWESHKQTVRDFLSEKRTASRMTFGEIRPSFYLCGYVHSTPTSIILLFFLSRQLRWGGWGEYLFMRKRSMDKLPLSERIYAPQNLSTPTRSPL